MRDRISANPGRVLVKPENGNAEFYATLERADNPIQEGDALNKANLLTDATAALFGFGENAVPNDAFNKLGVDVNKLNEITLHWWKRRTEETGYVWRKVTAKVSEVRSTGYGTTMTGTRTTYYYATKYSFSNGTFTLTSPSSVAVTADNMSTAETNMKGKYIIESSKSGTTMYYGGNNGTFSLGAATSGSKYYVILNNVTQYTGEQVYYENLGEWEFVSSADRNAYPDSGTSGGFAYQYLSIPFENAREGARIATGSYGGTGTYGADNPNILTFEFTPRFIWVFGTEGLYTYGSTSSSGRYTKEQFMIAKPAAFVKMSTTGTTSADGAKIYATWGATTFSWYADDITAAQGQLNANGTTYNYIAIG